MAVFLFFSDDWGRHPSSSQHLAHCLLANDANSVIWVNTIGTRPPGWNVLTFRRAAEKLRVWLSVRRNHGKKSSCNREPEVLHPRMWPWFRSAFDRVLNRKLLFHALARRLDREKDVTVITTLPIAADLVGILPNVRQWVYYCVDDWSRWPGMDAKPLAEMEAKLVQKVDKIVTVGEALRARIRRMGRDSMLLTHGVDLDFWRVAAKLPKDAPVAAILPEVLRKELSKPVFVFWGLIDERLEPEMITRLATEIPEGTLILAGPVAAQDVVEKMKRFSNIVLPGAVPYEALPQLASMADVLLMPYRKNEATEQIQPLKMTEYLASGKPAVVTNLQAAEEWKDALDVTETAEEFVETVKLRVKTGLPETQTAARERLKKETWEEKTNQLETFLSK